MYADHISLLACLAGILTYTLRHRSLVQQLSVLVALSIALFAPLGPYTGLEIAVAAAGSLSVTSIIVCCLLGVSALRPLPLAAREQLAGIGLILATGTVLYGSAFGFTWLDMYAFGFDKRIWPIVALGLLTLSTLCLWHYIPVIVAAVSYSYAAKFLPSSNWLDYLIDPALWVGALIALVIQMRMRKREIGNRHLRRAE